MIIEEIIFILSDILCVIMLIGNLIVYWKIDKLLKEINKENKND